MRTFSPNNGMTEAEREKLSEIDAKAVKGANGDITSLSGLTTALSVAQGGTGSTTNAGARSNLGVAAKGANSDITSLSALIAISNSGYSQFGSDAPAIKFKKITGTTPTVNNATAYSTGIAKSDIISFTVQVSDSGDIWRLPNHGIQGTATEYYFAYINANGTLSISLPLESTAVHTCAFVCLITYEE